MLKLIIADDERIIRETISTIIHWENYDIEVVGLCKNGMETYDMIMDESPDIVLTDIKMPGMDGLELINRVSRTDLNVQFIILSGYGEFEYAKEAMKNGVKYYLLKPCNEAQIIECIEQCKQDCYQQKIMERIVSERFTAVNRMNHNVIFSIINDSICQNRSFPEIIRAYESYIDFRFTVYRLYYVYFLPFKHLEEFLDDLRLFCCENISSVIIHGIYVNNTLLLFFRDFAANYQDLERFIRQRHYPDQAVTLETESVLYSSLKQLLVVVLKKIRRFGMIYYINDFHLLYTCNYNTHINELELLCQSILGRQEGALGKLTELIKDINDITFLKQIASNLFMKLTLNNPKRSSIELTEWLMLIENSQSLTDLKNLVIDKVREILCEPDTGQTVSAMTRQIFDYVSQNLQDDNLTLKYISENYLFMNVDYVSKRFIKETGVRFSNYLADIRIKKAKQLLASRGLDKIQTVAEEVGLGNNPQYFSQLFKKKTGMTPSSYIDRVCGRANR